MFIRRRRWGRRVLTILTIVAAWPAPVALAAPPWLEGLGSYRIMDASGRIAPRTEVTPGGRVALRPAYAPNLLLRGRPYYLSGYAGAVYGRQAGQRGLDATGYHVQQGGHAHGHTH
jgi:hypothetical protein